MKACAMCGKAIDTADPKTRKKVTGWVGGPRKDSMRLREDTGEYAHEECIDNESKGMPPQQPDLFASLDAITFQPGDMTEDPVRVVRMRPIDEDDPLDRDWGIR